MEPLALEEFEGELDLFDATVADTEGIDHFCSASDWILAARAAWSQGTPWIRRCEGGYAVMLEHTDPGGLRMLLGLDTMWGFSCPLVGDVTAEFAEAIRAADRHVLLVTGVEPATRLFDNLLHAFREFDVRRGPLLRRWVATLDETYLARRGRKLRENLRRAARRAQDASIEFATDDGADAPGLLRRILAVEERSWKGATKTGLLTPDMYAFYSALAGRLAPRGRLRVLFAQRDGEDVGYILGGVRDAYYRGFQFSFDDRFRAISLGALLQLKQIEALQEAGIEHYDLGMDMPYKRRWADRPFDTVTLAIIRR